MKFYLSKVFHDLTFWRQESDERMDWRMMKIVVVDKETIVLVIVTERKRAREKLHQIEREERK